MCIKNARESPYSAIGFEKNMSMKLSSSKHFLHCYLNITCLGFDQKSKKYRNMHLISSFISKLLKNQENEYEIFYHIKHEITYNHVKYINISTFFRKSNRGLENSFSWYDFTFLELKIHTVVISSQYLFGF